MTGGEAGVSLTAMVRRLPPDGAPVVPGSTPVVSFGDLRQASVATLGINPSVIEFVEGGRLLAGSHRRLATLSSLGAERCDLLTDGQVQQVIHDCAAYFTRRPYTRWFGPLDRLIASSLQVSYYDGSACHLDLVQWATDPIWRDIQDPVIRTRLIDDGLPHLRVQLAQESLRLVLLNGRTVLDHVQRAGVVQLTVVGELPLGQTRCSLYAGVEGDITFLGWSANLQSSHGVSSAFTGQLTEWMAAQGRTRLIAVSPIKEAAMPGQEPIASNSGFIVRGTTVEGKRALAALLESWVRDSGAPTIGDTGNYGGRPWVRIYLGQYLAVLNADTKRTAVKEFLGHLRAHPAEDDWWVMPNRNGKVNKVTYGGPGAATPGWYCYLTEELAAPSRI